MYSIPAAMPGFFLGFHLQVRVQIMAKHLKEVYLNGPIGDLLNHFLAAYGAARTYELRDKLTSAFLENDRKTIDEILPNVCEPDFDALSVLVARCHNKVFASNTLKELNRRYLGVPLGPGGYKDESGALRRGVSPGDSPEKTPELADAQVETPDYRFVSQFLAHMDLLCLSADAQALSTAIDEGDFPTPADVLEAIVVTKQTTRKMFVAILNELPRVCELAKKDSQYLQLVSDSTTVLAKISQLLLPAKAPVKDEVVKD
jgi:hypothetical protein